MMICLSHTGIHPDPNSMVVGKPQRWKLQSLDNSFAAPLKSGVVYFIIADSDECLSRTRDAAPKLQLCGAVRGRREKFKLLDDGDGLWSICHVDGPSIVFQELSAHPKVLLSKGPFNAFLLCCFCSTQ